MNELPFHSLVNYDLACEFQSAKNVIKQKMDCNNMREFMINNKLNNIFSFDETMKCQYYDEDMFIKSYFDNGQHINILTLNIRSLPKHGGNLLCLLSSLKIKFQLSTLIL